MRLAVIILIFLVCVPGCNLRSRSKDGLIRSVGTYGSVDDCYSVTVTSESRSIIRYTVFDQASGKKLAEGGGFSDFMRWFLYWDESNQLWVYDSDIGGFGYWAKSGDASMKFHQIDGTFDKSLVPTPVVDNVPSSILRQFGWEP